LGFKARNRWKNPQETQPNRRQNPADDKLESLVLRVKITRHQIANPIQAKTAQSVSVAP
jgi:hypothetical protein